MMDMKEALYIILRYMIDTDAESFNAECKTDTGITATLEITLIEIKETEGESK